MLSGFPLPKQVCLRKPVHRPSSRRPSTPRSASWRPALPASVKQRDKPDLIDKPLGVPLGGGLAAATVFASASTSGRLAMAIHRFLARPSAVACPFKTKRKKTAPFLRIAAAARFNTGTTMFGDGGLTLWNSPRVEIGLIIRRWPRATRPASSPLARRDHSFFAPRLVFQWANSRDSRIGG